MGINTQTVTLESASSQQVLEDKKRRIMAKAQHLQQKPLTQWDLPKIVPLDAFDRLIESFENCVFFLEKERRRCKRRLFNTLDEAPEILESLAGLNVRNDWDAIYPKLTRIVEMSLCGSPHRRRAIDELAALDCRMIKWANDRDNQIVDPVNSRMLALVEPWFRIICRDSDVKVMKLRERLAEEAKAKGEDGGPNTASKSTDGSTIATASESLIASQQTSIARLPGEIQRMQYIQTFSPFHPRGFEYLSVRQAIRKVLEKPLKESELEEKYLYIYWFSGNFGHVKIGVTDNVPNRLKSWEEKCKHTAQEHLQHPAGQRKVVKYAERVEQLVHMELKEVRFEEAKCQGCGGRHIEWFRTSAEHAAKVIKKYSAWMESNPFEYDPRTYKWRLSSRIGEAKIREFCEPIVFQPLNSSPISARKTGPRRISSPGKQSPSRYRSPG